MCYMAGKLACHCLLTPHLLGPHSCPPFWDAPWQGGTREAAVQFVGSFVAFHALGSEHGCGFQDLALSPHLDILDWDA